MEPSNSDLLASSREIWDANADAWDKRMSEGGGWPTLILPAIERILNVQPSERVLDIACGNGRVSRRLAELGAGVVASDFSPRLIELARQRTTEHRDRITYHVADATNEAELLALGGQARQLFDAAICVNALMDMPAIEPLFRATRQMIKPQGRLIFSIMHPCFNGVAMTMQPELPDYAAKPTHCIKVSRYLSAEPTKGLAIAEQPREQYYWHRPLHAVFNAAFNNGWVLDRLEEPAKPAKESGASAQNAFDWANYDMPPLLFARMRPAPQF